MARKWNQQQKKKKKGLTTRTSKIHAPCDWCRRCRPMDPPGDWKWPICCDRYATGKLGRQSSAPASRSLLCRHAWCKFKKKNGTLLYNSQMMLVAVSTLNFRSISLSNSGVTVHNVTVNLDHLRYQRNRGTYVRVRLMHKEGIGCPCPFVHVST